MNQRSIYVSTSCLPGVQSIKSRIKAYKDQGLNHIELGAGVLATDDGLSHLMDLNCDLLVHNYFPQTDKSFVLNLASPNRTTRRRSIEFVLSAIDLSAALKAPFYSVHAGFITDPTGFGSTSFIFPSPQSPDEERKAIDRFISSLELCVTHARKIGLQILVENNVCSPELRGKLLLQTAEEFLALFDALHSPALGILLDTGHLNVSARTYGFDRTRFIEDVAGFVRAFHVHDNSGREDTHMPINAESWIVDVLRKNDFAGLPVVIEARFNDVKALRCHVDWLRREVS